MNYRYPRCSIQTPVHCVYLRQLQSSPTQTISLIQSGPGPQVNFAEHLKDKRQKCLKSCY